MTFGVPDGLELGRDVADNLLLNGLRESYDDGDAEDKRQWNSFYYFLMFLGIVIIILVIWKPIF